MPSFLYMLLYRTDFTWVILLYLYKGPVPKIDHIYPVGGAMMGTGLLTSTWWREHELLRHNDQRLIDYKVEGSLVVCPHRNNHRMCHY